MSLSDLAPMALIMFVGGLLNIALAEPVARLHRSIGFGEWLSDPAFIRLAGYFTIAASCILLGLAAIDLYA